MSQSISVGELESTPNPLRRFVGFAMTLGASFGAFGCFALQGILLARLLGPVERGVFAVAIMFPQALLYLGLLGAPELFAGYAAQGLPNAALRRSAARYGLTAGILSMTACIVLDLLTIPAAMRSVMPLAVLCAMTMPLQQIRLAVQAVDHGQRRLNRYNHVRLAAAAMFPLMLLVGALLGFRDLTSACALFVLAQIAGLSLAQFGMDESWFGKVAIAVPRALKEARGLMQAWLSTELLERLDLILVMVLVASKSTLGFYATAVPIASLMIVVPNAVGLYAFNRGARQDERLSTQDAWRFLLTGLVIQSVCALVLAAALPWLVEFFYGEDFAPAVRFAWLLLPAGAFRGLLQAADSYLRARKKPGLGVKARAVGIPILIAISLLGYPILGAAAIAAGLSVAQLICFLIVAAGVVRDTSQR